MCIVPRSVEKDGEDRRRLGRTSTRSVLHNDSNHHSIPNRVSSMRNYPTGGQSDPDHMRLISGRHDQYSPSRARPGLLRDDNFDVLVQRGQEPHQPLNGKPVELVTRQRRDFRLADPKRLRRGNLGPV
jgi:hypothetical protein